MLADIAETVFFEKLKKGEGLVSKTFMFVRLWSSKSRLGCLVDVFLSLVYYVVFCLFHQHILI